MPRLARWTNVAQDLLTDPEFKELTQTYGLEAGFAWIEMLNQAEVNHGFLKGTAEEIADRTYLVILGLVTGQNVRKNKTRTGPRLHAKISLTCLKTVTYVLDCGWIEHTKDGFILPNWPKYHKIRGRRETHPSFLPSYKKEEGRRKDRKGNEGTENPTLEAAGSPSARNGDGKGGSGRTEGERRSGNNRRKIWRPEDWTPDPDSPGAALLGLRGEEWEREADRIVRDLVARGWTPEEIRRSVDWYWPFDEDFTSERGS